MPEPVTAVIQARMSSQRLPGKVLRDLKGKPLLGHLYDRLKSCPGIDQVIIATSTDVSDNAVETYCSSRKISCFRGDLNNVAKRFADLIQERGLKSVLRANADSPFLDPAVVSQGIELFNSGNWDLVTNTFRRSFPKGQSVEIIKAPVFIKGFQSMADSFEKEHITQHFYRNSDQYRIFNFECTEGNFAADSLSIDIEQDFKICEQILTRLQQDGKGTWQSLLKKKEEIQAQAAR